MEILNRFVDWKKNIQPIAYYGIGAYFDINVTSFEEVKGQIFSNFNLVPDLKLKKYLLLGDISFEKSKYGYGYECMQDFDMNPNHAIENRKGGRNSSRLVKKCSKKCLRLPSADSFSFFFRPDFTK